jgi:hypothetical protein
MLNGKERPLVLLAAVLTAISAAFGQGVPSQPTKDDIVRENLEQRMNTMRNLDVLSRRTAKENRESLKTTYFRPELTEELEQRLEVAPSVLAVYGELLRQTGTGAVKLLAQANCEKIRKSSKLVECYQQNANIREFANAYSFRENKRAVFARSDIAVTSDYLVAGRHSVQTLIVRLGPKEVQWIDRDSPEIGYLFEFTPAPDAKGMDAQFEELKNGLTVVEMSGSEMKGARSYSKTARIVPGEVYAIRCIAYRPEGSEALEKDRDVVVVFKIVETPGEAGTTLVWKEIYRGDGMVMESGKDANEN